MRPVAATLPARIRATATDLDTTDLLADDVVHNDFHRRNLLTHDRRITAVVDWDGAGDGDATFDLVTLAFCAVVGERPDDAVERLSSVAAARRPRGVVWAYAAHCALHQVDWSVRHRSPAELEAWLDPADAALDRTAA